MKIDLAQIREGMKNVYNDDVLVDNDDRAMGMTFIHRCLDVERLEAKACGSSQASSRPIPFYQSTIFAASSSRREHLL